MACIACTLCKCQISSVRRANARISIFCHVVIMCLLSSESVNKVNPHIVVSLAWSHPVLQEREWSGNFFCSLLHCSVQCGTNHSAVFCRMSAVITTSIGVRGHLQMKIYALAHCIRCQAHGKHKFSRRLYLLLEQETSSFRLPALNSDNLHAHQCPQSLCINIGSCYVHKI